VTGAAFLPYGRQDITEDDVAAVAEALRGQLITQGPRVDAFEAAFAEQTGARFAVAFANGTGALHAAAAAAGLGPGDRMPTTPLSFVASSNCALFVGARPSFYDVDRATANLDTAAAVAAGAFDGAKACVVVSLAGLPADLAPLQPLRRDRGLIVIEDACHALGGRRAGKPIGGDGQADMAIFSLHPVKAMTTGEGGVVTTDDEGLAAKLRTFRTHGMVRGAETGGPLHGPWHYDVGSLGFNYRITDFQCALGESQLLRLPHYVEERNRVADRYHALLDGTPGLTLPARATDGDVHGYHLFVVRFDEGAERRRFMADRLREAGIGTQLHYIPIYHHSLYRGLGFGEETAAACPNAERYYATALSLPMYPGLTDADVERVGAEVSRWLEEPIA
jgi:dTDP-4-amino-4,6-dideoxygalactose transaminase